MHDKDGKPVGILAHELKTDTSKMSDGDMIISLDKNLENLKINDQASNQDIIYYNNPRPSTNKETLLGMAELTLLNFEVLLLVLLEKHKNLYTYFL